MIFLFFFFFEMCSRKSRSLRSFMNDVVSLLGLCLYWSHVLSKSFLILLSVLLLFRSLQCLVVFLSRICFAVIKSDTIFIWWSSVLVFASLPDVSFGAVPMCAGIQWFVITLECFCHRFYLFYFIVSVFYYWSGNLSGLFMSKFEMHITESFLTIFKWWYWYMDDVISLVKKML